MEECRPKAVIIESVRGILDAAFGRLPKPSRKQLGAAGYRPDWRMHNATDLGVSQLRPRVAGLPAPQVKLTHYPYFCAEQQVRWYDFT
jgi:site-specific DNA-cytosine methylase